MCGTSQRNKTRTCPIIVFRDNSCTWTYTILLLRFGARISCNFSSTEHFEGLPISPVAVVYSHYTDCPSLERSIAAAPWSRGRALPNKGRTILRGVFTVRVFIFPVDITFVTESVRSVVFGFFFFFFVVVIAYTPTV